VKTIDSLPEIYGIRRFITAFTRAPHLSLSWETPIQYTPQQAITPRSILILSTHLRLVPVAFQPIIYTSSSSTPLVLHARPSHTSRLEYSNYAWESTNYEYPRYAVFSILPSLNLSSVQISSLAPCSRTLSAYVPPSMSEIKFHTHTKPQAKL
jgi:hypothetical protein